MVIHSDNCINCNILIEVTDKENSEEIFYDYITDEPLCIDCAGYNDEIGYYNKGSNQGMLIHIAETLAWDEVMIMNEQLDRFKGLMLEFAEYTFKECQKELQESGSCLSYSTAKLKKFMKLKHGKK